MKGHYHVMNFLTDSILANNISLIKQKYLALKTNLLWHREKIAKRKTELTSFSFSVAKFATFDSAIFNFDFVSINAKVYDN